MKGLNQGYYSRRINRQKAVTGFVFSLPVIIGIIFLFLVPLSQSLFMAFSDVSVARGTGLHMEWIGFQNFVHAFRKDPDFSKNLVDAFVNMGKTVPIIVFMSFFCAILINQKFPGRSIARVIFFLPIIYASSAMLKVDSGDVMQQAMQSSSYKSIEVSQGFLQSFQLAEFIQQFGLPEEFVGFLTSIVDQVFQIVSLSGVQILIMLAALQSISPSLYEAAYVEGAGGWEKFWLITFPMASSSLLLCLIYSIIDSFIAYNNPIVVQTQNLMNNMTYDVSAAMSWVYFALIAVVLGLVALIGSRLVFTYDKQR